MVNDAASSRNNLICSQLEQRAKYITLLFLSTTATCVFGSDVLHDRIYPGIEL